ncbi:hypothetical protein DFP72DRAFT_985955 [Ephemerocybe angulata]|uniref:PhoD-like phosphatase domain-containing protein n=1 Tax=Ephemerocybe angulata TaxID=980116 RepID=A0A8H6IIK0_9AGAR|nr:hypothetical protein DFP72DRAFT_985955 [Tulosesus angulatus]
MDNAGWHAQRRARKVKMKPYANTHRLPGGQYAPVDTIGPMAEPFIGGFQPYGPSTPPLPHKHDHGHGHHGLPPPLPPKDGLPHLGSPTSASSQYQHHTSPPASAGALNNRIHGKEGTTLTKMSAVERSRLLRVARMEPHLQFMCGPLLRFDTIDEHGIWHGAAMIVTADAGSIYEPFPMLTYEWDPDRGNPTTFASLNINDRLDVNGSASQGRGRSASTATTIPSPVGGGGVPDDSWNKLNGVKSFDLGPHPADPHSTVLPVSPSGTTFTLQPSQSSSSGQSAFAAFPYGGPSGYGLLNGHSPNACQESVSGQEYWVYGGAGGTFTFWRFLIKVPLAENEMMVTYSVNGGQKMGFHVPGRRDNMRLAIHSCNGFSAGVNPDDFRGPGFKTGYDPVWMDLLSKHAEKPFHALVGGGDQLYCDSLMREPEMQDWVSKMKPEEKKKFPLKPEMAATLDRFFFNHYCQHFRSGAFARANSSIPMLNMCDPEDLQSAPVFKAIGARGYFFFLIFQTFTNPEIDGLNDAPGKHVYQSLVLGDQGPIHPIPKLGPKEWILMLDCRAERKKEQVCSPGEYEKVFARMRNIPSDVEHLIVQLGIPIAYPRMVFLEQALESKFNPLVALGRNGTMGLSGFVNKFNAEAELLDDLNDHWTARSHKRERNWFIAQLQIFAKARGIRVTFVSGDVHCAAVGILKTLKSKNTPEIKPENDHRYMLNVTSSAIVNTPPPNGVITLVSSLAGKVHKTLHSIETDECMQRYIMGRRNWCVAEYDERTGGVLFDIRVEREKGYGATCWNRYSCQAPAPRWGKEAQ